MFMRATTLILSLLLFHPAQGATCLQYLETQTDDQVPSSTVVSGLAKFSSKTYLAKGRMGLSVLSEDGTEFQVREAFGRRIIAEGLQAGPGQLWVFGQSHGDDVFSANRDFRVFLFEIDEQGELKAKKLIEVDLKQALEKPGRSIVDLPNMSAAVNQSGSQLYISFSLIHEEPLIIRLDLEDEIQVQEVDWSEMKRNVLPLAGLRSPKQIRLQDHQLLVPSGQNGLMIYDLSTNNLLNAIDNIGYAVDAVVHGQTLFVADHEGGVRCISQTTGEQSVHAVNSWITSIAVIEGKIWITHFEGYGPVFGN